ncbi:MAG: ABC-type transport auxiliary lipoprotein family protein [Acidocella sp.]|uniref:ABC-type transport auxiliary lipoprotein family protein n=1 Tax=Acidocella sp. TaxID=50710 RepID=UPI003FD82C16
MPRRRIVLAAPLALAACASLLPAQKYTPRANWPLQPAPPAAVANAGTGPVLMIRPIAAAPGLEARGLQSLAADGSLDVDYYNLWAVPPADAVTQALLDWSQASGAFSAVVTPGSRLQPDLIVEGELTELLADPSRGEARAALTLVFIKPSGTLTGTALPVAQAMLKATAPLQGNDPAAMAAAQNNALSGLLTQAMAQLERAALK